jgi:cytoskeletal protein CcmA (bactofilin family)
MFNLKRRIHDSISGPTTHVATSTKIVGTITGQGAYIFSGTIEGDCDIDGSLMLCEGGRWKGTMKATDIIVGGIVEGDVVARQRIEIVASARVTGSLRGKSIAVSEGAIIDGEIEVTSGKAPVKFQEKRQT